MTETEIVSSIEQIESLINSYDFDLDGWSASALIAQWLEQYEPDWLKLAVIESLYQGRYKAFSVQQILNLWQRRGSPIYHFTYEFERLICRNIPTFSTTANDLPDIVNITDDPTNYDLLNTISSSNLTDNLTDNPTDNLTDNLTDIEEELTDHETDLIVAVLQSANSPVTAKIADTTLTNTKTDHLAMPTEQFYNKLRAIALYKESPQNSTPVTTVINTTTMQDADNSPLESGVTDDYPPGNSPLNPP